MLYDHTRKGMVGDVVVASSNRIKHLAAQHAAIAAIVFSGLFSTLPNTAQASDATALVSAAARRHGVPVAFALRMAKIESGIKCGVHNSRSSASGPVQVTRGTARAMGYRGNIRTASCATQTEYGMKALAMCWRASNGRPALARRCHQVGISAVYGRHR